ncbi:hypothetical protein GGR41_002175 [Paenalcaligenes hominis]|uniref:NrtR DNA-binding winged helix domain-containing protein n=1 Tax=Paenalcaligenes hominis TaxID=643674 RepID=A0ABX0WT14_9BURK|nr:hypothetical protein [Paenalcaligenes hominis]NJB65920.1 hypothetical protein [Paenalcaligenes hominis]
MTMHEAALSAELVAVLVAVTGDQPRVLTTHCARALPAGPLQHSHRSLQNGLRQWVEEQTHHKLGYVEQLYTFADKGRFYASGERVISVSYLALTIEAAAHESGVGWQDWYRYFPWEDWRDGTPACLDAVILPALQAWAVSEPEFETARWQRMVYAFGLDGFTWSEDMVLQRYELLYEAGLVAEATRAPLSDELGAADPVYGLAMRYDHRRILATGMARLRAKIKYRPVMFELMPDAFTLLQLQKTVEAIAGRALHKQNFRRLIEQQNLVEETGVSTVGRAGRPAKLFSFKGDVIAERAIAGTTLPLARQAR